MRLLRGAIATIGGVAVVATVLGSLGGFFWGFDLLANFRLQYLVALGVAATLLGALGAGRTAMLMAAGALFNAALIAPLYTGDQPPAAGDERLVVVSMNTQLSNPNQQLPWILAQEPDVVLFFESSRLGEESLRDLDTGYQVTSGIRNDRQFGVTVLSRERIDLVLLRFAEAGGGAVRFEMALGDRQVAVYGIHPPSPSNPWRSTARNRFMEQAGVAIAEDELPAIVVGDFNSTPWSAAFRLLTGPADLANSQIGFGYSGTWPAQLPALVRIPIDHLVYDEGLTVVEREVGPELAADHRPIRVVVARAAGDTGEGASPAASQKRLSPTATSSHTLRSPESGAAPSVMPAAHGASPAL